MGMSDGEKAGSTANVESTARRLILKRCEYDFISGASLLGCDAGANRRFWGENGGTSRLLSMQIPPRRINSLSERPPGVHYMEVRSGSHHPGFMIETAASISYRASTSSNMTSRGSWKIAQTLSPGASNCTVLPLTTSGLRLLAIKIGLPVRRKGNEARDFLRATSASGYPSATRLIDKFLGGFFLHK